MMFSNTKSILNHTMAQLFVNNQGYMKITPMKLKSEAGFALKELIQDVGIPYHMHTDEDKETTLGTWRKVCKEHSIAMSNTEPHSPFQNRAEAGIGELRRYVNRLMARTNTPKKLWDFFAVSYRRSEKPPCLTIVPITWPYTHRSFDREYTRHFGIS